MSTLFEQITTKENFQLAYEKTQRGQYKYRIGAIKYSENITHNLRALRSQVVAGTYEPKGYHKFKVYEPKERIVHAPCYRDKIVQHAINNILLPWYSQRFIGDSYACIPGKGNFRAVLQLQKYIRTNEYLFADNSFITKADVSKFFYSINREILKNIITREIPCYKTVRLLCCVIDSSPEDKGLPLGNLTSQLLANVYMNQLDQYMKRVVRAKYYVRYADDIFVICSSSSQASRRLLQISDFLYSQLDLDLHPKKSFVLSSHRGLDALGYKIYGDHILLKRDFKLRLERKIRSIPKLVRKGESIKKIEQSLNSSLNHANIANSHNFIQKLLKKYIWLDMDITGNLRITLV